MPQRKAALQELIKNDKKKTNNIRIKNRLKKAVKLFLTILDSKDTEKTKNQLNKVCSELDKAAKKNTIHKNKAARLKSKFTKKANQSSKSS